MYRTLDPNQIIKTLMTLNQRIEDRFPSSGLSQVCAELVLLARETESRIAATSRPNVALRIAIASVLAAGILMLSKVGAIIELKRESENLSGVLQGVDSAFNILLLTGGGMLYLTTLESRWSRHKIMTHLHELRSIVHVVDMHQLSKDPSSDRPATVAVPQKGAPQRVLSPFELARYLDYCSEMLSLTGKVAALYAQASRDSLVIAAASDIDQMTANLSQKIWQKISIIQAREACNSPMPQSHTQAAAALQKPQAVNSESTAP